MPHNQHSDRPKHELFGDLNLGASMLVLMLLFWLQQYMAPACSC